MSVAFSIEMLGNNSHNRRGFMFRLAATAAAVIRPSAFDGKFVVIFIKRTRNAGKTSSETTSMRCSCYDRCAIACNDYSGKADYAICFRIGLPFLMSSANAIERTTSIASRASFYAPSGICLLWTRRIRAELLIRGINLHIPMNWPGLIEALLISGQYRIQDLDKVMYSLHKQYGKIAKVGGLIGHPDLLFVFDGDEIRKIFKKEETLPHRPSMPSLHHYKSHLRKEFFGDSAGLIGV